MLVCWTWKCSYLYIASCRLYGSWGLSTHMLPWAYTWWTYNFYEEQQIGTAVDYHSLVDYSYLVSSIWITVVIINCNYLSVFSHTTQVVSRVSSPILRNDSQLNTVMSYGPRPQSNPAWILCWKVLLLLGSIDHISIRQLQCVLLKIALIIGVEVSYPPLLPPL